MPRFDVFYYAFGKLGFKKSIVSESLSSIYSLDMLHKRMKTRMAYFLKTFESIGALQLESLAQRLSNMGLS